MTNLNLNDSDNKTSEQFKKVSAQLEKLRLTTLEYDRRSEVDQHGKRLKSIMHDLEMFKDFSR
jgi:hypothetical protein